MKKTILPVCAALLLTAGLVSCGGGNEGTNASQATTNKGGKKISLTVWVPTEQVSWAEERIEAFKAAYPTNSYNITVTACAEGDAKANILKDPTASADVFFFAGDHLGELVTGNYLYEFPSTFIDALKTEIESSVLSSAMVDGKLYGIPYTPNSYFMYYNGSKVTADEAKDLDSLLSKGKVIFDIDNGWYQTAFWYGTGVRFFGENGNDPTTANLNSAEGKLAAKAIRDYVMEDNFINGGDEEIKRDFKKDSDIVAVVGGSWLSADLTAALGNDLKATVLPTFTAGGTKYPLTATGDWKKCGISSYTTEPTEAVNLALWLTNSDSMLQKFNRFNETPILKSLSNNEDILANDISAALMKQTNTNCVLQPTISQMGNWWDAATAYANALLDARNNGTEFADSQCEEWAEKLQEDLLKTIIESN